MEEEAGPGELKENVVRRHIWAGKGGRCTGTAWVIRRTLRLENGGLRTNERVC